MKNIVCVTTHKKNLLPPVCKAFPFPFASCQEFRPNGALMGRGHRQQTRQENVYEECLMGVSVNKPGGMLFFSAAPVSNLTQTEIHEPDR